MLSITAFTDIGKRPYQEDRYTVVSKFAGSSHLTLALCADGHGGHQTSTFLANEYPKQLMEVFKEQRLSEHRKKFVQMMGIALERCIQIWDKRCFGSFYGKITNDKTKKQFYEQRDEKSWKENGLEAGSTLVAMLIDMKKRRAHVLNIGDSRAAWIIGEEKIASTVDHSVKKKMSPIKGFSFENSEGRLQGDLAMSHSVGDNTPELYGVVSRKYDIDTVHFKEKSFRAVIASDGLFDIASNHNVLYEPFTNAETLANEMLKRRQEEVNNICLEAGMPPEEIPKVTAYEDNVTIVYIKIANMQNGTKSEQSDEDFMEEGEEQEQEEETSTTIPQINNLAKPLAKTKEELQAKLMQAQDLLTKFSSLMNDMKAEPEPKLRKRESEILPSPPPPIRKKSIDRLLLKRDTKITPEATRKKSIRRDPKTKTKDEDNNVTIKFLRKQSRERK